MSTVQPLSIVVRRHFEVPAIQVFDAWLDPEIAAKWLFATPAGEMIHADIDPQVGGEFCFIDRRGDEDIEHLGEYLEIDRPRRLAFLFTVNKSDDVSRVAVDIVAAGRGCDLTLTHAMDPKWAEFADRTKSGWEMVLDGLATALLQADR